MEHSASLSLFSDYVLRLLFGPHEHDRSALCYEVRYCVVSAVEHADRLLEVNDVDTITRAEDIWLHLRIPAAGLVPEVNSCLKQLFHTDFGHSNYLKPLSY